MNSNTPPHHSYRICLTGNFEISYHGTALPAVPKAGAVLIALLCVHAGKPVSRAEAAEIIWPDKHETTRRDYLRHVLTKIKHSSNGISERIYTPLEGYLAIDLRDVECDWLTLQELLANPDPAAFSAALNTYRGPLMKDSHNEWVIEQRHALHALLASSAETIVQSSNLHECLPLMKRGYELLPFSDVLVRSVMLGYAASGLNDEAAEIYENFRLRLKRLNGTKPSEETARLHADIRLSASVKTLREPKRRKRALPAKGNLPGMPGKLFGRSTELMEVCALLESCNLVSLIGPGGIGKTQLALHAATAAVRDYAGGTWFIDLSAAQSEADIWQALYHTVCLEATSGQSSMKEAVLNVLGKSDALLIADNCEQIIDACRAAIQELRACCPNVTILVTSRIALRLPGEKIVKCTPLQLPSSRVTRKLGAGISMTAAGLCAEDLLEFSSVALYVYRAQHATRTFVLDDTSAAAVSEICQLMDGIPLAIELCASWSRCLTAREIAERLRERLTLARTPDTSIPARHRTLEAAIQWSFDLLSAPEQAFWQITALLPEGFTLAQAAAIVRAKDGEDEDTCLNIIRTLVDSSILQMITTGNGVRYRYPETIRRFGAEKCTSVPYRALLVSIVGEAAREREPELTGAQQSRALRDLDGDYSNYRAILKLGLQHTMASESMDIALGIWRYCYARGLFEEGYALLAAVLEQESLAPNRAPAAHTAAGNLALHSGNAEAAKRHFETARHDYEARGDKNGAARAIGSLSLIASQSGNYDLARTLLEQAKQIFEETNDTRGVSVCLGNLAIAASHQGDYEAASAYYEQSQILFREDGDIQRLAIGCGNLCGLYVTMKRFDRALPIAIEGIELSLQHFSPTVLAHLLLSATALFCYNKQFDAAAITLGADSALRKQYYLPLTSDMKAEQDTQSQLARAQMSDDTFNTKIQHGEELGIEELLQWLHSALKQS